MKTHIFHLRRPPHNLASTDILAAATTAATTITDKWNAGQLYGKLCSFPRPPFPSTPFYPEAIENVQKMIIINIACARNVFCSARGREKGWRGGGECRLTALLAGVKYTPRWLTKAKTLEWHRKKHKKPKSGWKKSKSLLCIFARLSKANTFPRTQGGVAVLAGTRAHRPRASLCTKQRRRVWDALKMISRLAPAKSG